MRKNTVASLAARTDALEGKMDQILALLEAQAPAKTVRKAPAKKTPAKKAPKVDTPKAATKGEQGYRTGTGMTRKAWNNTLSAKARLAGRKGASSVYALVMADWAEVQNLRNAGATPDEVLALFV